MLIFVGMKEKLKPEIFESEKVANTETHPKFDMVFGPFKSIKDAESYVKAMDQGVACSEG